MPMSKNVAAFIALIVGAVLGLWAMLLPPQGEVEESILVLVAQFLLFASTMLGIDSKFDRLIRLLRKK